MERWSIWFSPWPMDIAIIGPYFFICIVASFGLLYCSRLHEALALFAWNLI